MADEKRLSFIEEQLKHAGESAPKVGVLKTGDLCAAEFSQDKQVRAAGCLSRLRFAVVCPSPLRVSV